MIIHSQCLHVQLELSKSRSCYKNNCVLEMLILLIKFENSMFCFSSNRENIYTHAINDRNYIYVCNYLYGIDDVKIFIFK